MVAIELTTIPSCNGWLFSCSCLTFGQIHLNWNHSSCQWRIFWRRNDFSCFLASFSFSLILALFPASLMKPMDLLPTNIRLPLGGVALKEALSRPQQMTGWSVSLKTNKELHLVRWMPGKCLWYTTSSQVILIIYLIKFSLEFLNFNCCDSGEVWRTAILVNMARLSISSTFLSLDGAKWNISWAIENHCPPVQLCCVRHELRWRGFIH